ncbi:hypothetical protein KKA23_03370 [Patescibacteria group bacterium]|nr:hypothetical protein [Patescibacteria group bacterium]MBU3923198.1 hypothetical protein [Patescibacteria group bacterium]
MVEKIYRKFEQKRAEVLSNSEIKELSPEKEKEILKQTISEEIAKTSSSQQSDNQQVQDIQAQPKERQINLLIDFAFEKGIDRAIEVVKRMDNPYLLDEFHDTLVDELYNKLIETGKLKAL